jgi:RNase P/RNase MRP subunit POP5
MKALKPSMREKKRYLLIEGEELKKNAERAILDFTGVLGMSKTGLEFIKQGKDYAIISINRDAINNVRASFAVFSKRIEVKKVSGTLKGLKG